MAMTDKATWEFRPRPARDVTYLRTKRLQALRLHSSEPSARSFV